MYVQESQRVWDFVRIFTYESTKGLKMGQAQINVRTRACSRTFIARTKQAALTHHVRGKELSE